MNLIRFKIGGVDNDIWLSTPLNYNTKMGGNKIMMWGVSMSCEIEEEETYAVYSST